MKDSQLFRRSHVEADKYIKVNNERFSTHRRRAPSTH